MCKLKIHILYRLIIASLIFISQSRIVYSIPINFSESKFRHISVDNGLSNNNIHSIFQDSFGYLWFGTQYGLNKFDGYNFTVYQYSGNKSELLTGNTVSEIYEDCENRLWIGTESGISVYDLNLDSFEHISIFNNYGYIFRVDVYSIFEDSEDDLIILSNENLFIFDSLIDNDTSYGFLSTSENTFAVKGGRAVIEDNNGILWIATEGNGLKLFDKNTNKFISDTISYPILKYVPEAFLNNIYFHSPSETVYISSQNQGVFKCSNYTAIPERFMSTPENNTGISNNTVFDFYIDSRGLAWIATASGLDIYDSRSGTYNRCYATGRVNALSSNEIKVIFEDRLNNLWFGSTRTGLNILENINFNKHYKTFTNAPFNAAKLSTNPILCIWEDERQHIWLGTDWGGIDILDKDIVTKHISSKSNRNNTIGSQAVTSIFKDSRDNLWVGCFRGGLQHISSENGNVTKRFYEGSAPTSISNNSITHIFEDSHNYIWVATSGGGVNKYNYKTNEFTKFKSNNTWNGDAISTNFIIQTFEGHDGYIWFASYYGLNRYNPNTNTFTYFLANPNDSTSIGHNWVYSICSDNYGTIWVGTANGLSKYNPKTETFTNYNTKHGLPGNIINDKTGYLWISTSKGLAQLNPLTMEIKILDISGDLPGIDFTNGAAYLSSCGELIFGGSKGLVRFFPDSIKFHKNTSPDVLITDFKLSNKPVLINGKPLTKHISQTKHITLNHKQSVISFEYAAIGQVDTKNINYQYMLEGFDHNWVDAGLNRLVTYTNLKPGQYTLFIRASYNFEFDNSKLTTLKIKIKPAPHKTLLAKISYVALIISLLYIFRRYSLISNNRKNELLIERINLENEEKLTQRKLQFFTNIAHEIRTPLTLILGPINKLYREKNLKELELVRNNTNKLLNLVNQLLDFRKLNNGKMQLFLYRNDVIAIIKDLTNNFKERALQKNIHIKYHSELESYITFVDTDKFEKICNNLLSNAIKYNYNNGEIRINFDVTHDQATDSSVDFSNGYYSITISDSGIGIPSDEKDKIFDRFYTGKKNHNHNSTGIGLALTKEFVDLMQGTIEVRSIVGKGSTFKVSLPILNSASEHVNNEPFGGTMHELISNYQQNETLTQEKHTADTYADISKTMLLVDDNDDIRNYLRDIFKPDFKIITENTGQKGIESALMHYPDIIITDIMMPGIDGIEFCNRIKSDIKTSHIPVILLTAVSQIETKIKGLETGADDYIVKPFDERVLQLKVKNILKIREQVSQKYNEGNNPELASTSPNTIENEFMSMVISIINKNLSNPSFGVNDILTEVGMSRSVFYRKIKAVTKKSVVELIHSIRLQKAATLLKNTSLHIADVALKSGFNDTSYFIKLFKERFGVTPGDYKD